jgi:hypothetical protein
MLQCSAFDLKTRRNIADLPSVVPDWPLPTVLSNYSTATAKLYLDGAPPNWQRATMEGAALLAFYDDDDGLPQHAIQWAGWVNGATPQASQDVVELSLVTLEGYFDRRYQGDVTFGSTWGWRAVIDYMVTHNVATFTEPGIDGLLLDYAGDGTLVAPDPANPLVWQNTDNATVLGRMQQLIGQFGGEFTVEWAWSADGQSLIPTLVMGDRIGQVATLASPAVTFQYPGLLDDASQARDYSDGRGANKIVAFSSGEGTVTPYADPVYAADFEGRPTFEYRYSPKTSESDLTVLASYARQAMKILGPGARPITVSLATTDPNAMQGRRFGSDWRMGDDVGLVIGGIGQDGKDTVPAFPGGISGVVRVIGVNRYEATISPTLAEPTIYVEGA